MRYMNKFICLTIIASASFLLHGCMKDGALRFWHKFECTVNNIPYYDNPEIILPWRYNTPHMNYYIHYDGNRRLTFYSSILPKDDTKKYPQYDIRCTIWDFTLDMIGEELEFSMRPKTEDSFLQKISYLTITNMQTGTPYEAEGYMLISSYDEVQNKMFGVLKVETKDNGDDSFEPLILEGNFQVIVDIHNENY